MNICIVGPGALGTIFGALLKGQGHEVSLLAGRQAYVDAVEKNKGVVLKSNNGEKTVAVDMYCDTAKISPADLVIVLVKATQSANIAKILPSITKADGYVLTLQNGGLGNAQMIEKEFPKERLLIGTTSAGGTLLEPGVVFHTQNGNSFIGPYAGAPMEKVAEIAKVLNDADFPTEAEENMVSRMWEKLLNNVAINALAALTNTVPGQIKSNEDSFAIAKAAALEAIAVAKAEGVEFDGPAFIEKFSVIGKDANNRPSMWQDVGAKRKTEIDHINGAIYRLGQKHGIPTPINFTLTSLIKTLEANY